jgi:hypothetical protein
MTARVVTWSDGFGVWHATVSGESDRPERLARAAIRRALTEHGEASPGYRAEVVRVDKCACPLDFGHYPSCEVMRGGSTWQEVGPL